MALPGWKKILVVDLGFLGDTVHSVPALRALAASGAQVDVMTTPVGAEALRMVPEIYRIWVVPLRKPSPPWWQGVAQLSEIRSQKFDAAMTFSGADRNLFCVALSGARQRIAAVRRARWWLRFLPPTKTIAAPPPNQALFLQKLEVLKQLGWSGNSPGWDLKTPFMGETSTPVSAAPTVYLSVSAFGSPHKEWPLEKWSEAVRLVWKTRPEIHFLVGFAPVRREQDRAQRLMELSGDARRCRILGTSTTLVELAAILGKCGLFAGLDSGVLHLAMALGKPTVSIFRDYQGKPEWAPEGKLHRVFSRPCSCHQNKVDRCGPQPQCLSGVTAQEVADAILEMCPRPGQGS